MDLLERVDPSLEVLVLLGELGQLIRRNLAESLPEAWIEMRESASLLGQGGPDIQRWRGEIEEREGDERGGRTCLPGQSS